MYICVCADAEIMLRNKSGKSDGPVEGEGEEEEEEEGGCFVLLEANVKEVIVTYLATCSLIDSLARYAQIVCMCERLQRIS